jgi:hypothetical protein
MIGKNYEDMQKAGFKLTPEDISISITAALKMHIVGLGSEGNPFVNLHRLDCHPQDYSSQIITADMGKFKLTVLWNMTN